MAAADKRNAYSVLGLHKGATDDQIKQAYVQLVKKYDPEVHTERFMIIQNAFNRLKDPEKRAREDIMTFNVVAGNYAYSDEERAEIPEDKLEQAIQLLEQKRTAEPGMADQVVPKLIQVLAIRSYKQLQKNLLQEAMTDWLRMLELDPTHQRAKNNLLYAYCRLGYSYANHTLYDEALDLWEKAAQMNPDNHFIIHNIALACEFAGRVDQALRYWMETLRRWKSIWDRNQDDEYLKTCIIEAHRHQSEIGKPPDTGAVPQQPQGPPQPAAHGQARSAPGPQPPGAPAPAPQAPARDDLQQHMEILKLRPDDFDANFRVAHILIEQKKWSEAVAHLTELTKKFPRNIEVLNHLGWAQLNNQEVDTAFQTWNRAQKLDPKNFEVREALIKANMMMGRALRDKNLFVKSLVYFKSLAKLLPDSDEVHFELGRTYQMKGDFHPAYMEYQTVLKINPKHKQARSSLSELKMRRA
ncbi:tetratricopeptide repeat protein [Candidatus Sumerlaeota bacterium]|nr:tetratricopeptide repeat protein [Candidatus Sumerlaeota bacterium]